MADLSVFYKDDPRSDEYRLTTIGFLKRMNAQGQSEYLLGRHCKQGKWNGFGGKVGDKPEFKNETIELSLAREAKEEFNIKITNPEKRAIILFDFLNQQGQHNKVLSHVFFVQQHSGTIKPNREIINPTWFTVDRLPWAQMWPNDRIWLEELLTRDEFLEAEFKFDPDKGLLASETKMEWKPLHLHKHQKN